MASMQRRGKASLRSCPLHVRELRPHQPPGPFVRAQRGLGTLLAHVPAHGGLVELMADVQQTPEPH